MRTFIRFANWIMRAYLATPMAFRWVYWVLPLVYFLFPFDIVPDLIGGLGRIDDLLLVAFAFWALDRAPRFREFFQEAKEEKRSQSKQEGARMGGGEWKQTIRPPHVVLGIEQGANAAEIKKAYRGLLRMYHPDKFAHLGAEFEVTAKRRTQEIVAAYDKLK